MRSMVEGPPESVSPSTAFHAVPSPSPAATGRTGLAQPFEAHPEIPGLIVDFFAGRPVTVADLALPSPAAEGE